MPGERQESIDSQPTDATEWTYPPPPTPYDTVRDSFVMKGARLVVHFFTRAILHHYNSLAVSGADNVLDSWPCIITPNHSSHLDTLAVFAALPHTFVNRTCVLAARDYFFKNSLVSFGARLMANVIPIERSGTEMRGLLLSLAKLKEGKSILMYPEGTRANSEDIGRFKEGAVRLSRRSKVPIIPAYIRGSRESMPRTSRFPRPKPVEVFFGEPVRYWEGTFFEWDNLQAAADLERRVLALSRLSKREKE